MIIRFVPFMLSLFLLAGSFSNSAEEWQDAYAWLLWESICDEFYLCDIDADGIPELLVGGPEDPRTSSHKSYNVYMYIDHQIVFIGDVFTRTELWIDNNNVFGYDYGAGSGEVLRYNMNFGILYFDGEVSGYFYDKGDIIYWFRGSDGNNIIVTDETEAEYQRIQDSYIKLNRYNISVTNIIKIIYGGNYANK